MVKTKVLLLGANGLLGSHLIKPLEVQGFEAIPITRKEFNYTGKRKEVYDLLKKYSGVYQVINCIGYTDVKGSNTEKDRCYLLNVQLVEDIISVRNREIYDKKYYFQYVHISSDYVKDDFISKRGLFSTNYAFSKSIAERFVEKERDLIIRTSFKKRGTWDKNTGHKWVPHPVNTNTDWVDVIAPKIAAKISQVGITGLHYIGTEKKTLLDLARQENPFIEIKSHSSTDELLGYIYPTDVTMPI